MKLLSLLGVAVFGLVLLVANSNYYDYGLKVGSSETVLPQTDEFFITGDYEFKSVLFISSDKSLTVSIRHLIHPLRGQESAIAQVEFDLVGSGDKTFRVNSIEFAHLDLNGAKITPKENFKINENFYVLRYDSSQLSNNVREVVIIDFTYDGQQETVAFDEVLERVKRYNKAALWLCCS